MKQVVITGASRGIGYATSKVFLDAGWRVYACSRNLGSLELLRADYEERLVPVRLDLSDSNSIDEAVSIITSSDEALDVVIHNAGYLVNKPFLEITPEDIQRCYQVNTFGPFRFTQLLHPHLSSDAHVIAISSMGGFQGSVKFAGLSAYSSSKAAIANLIECWQEEFKGSQQSYNCLCIGAVQTEMLGEAFPGYEAPLQAEEMATFIYQFATQSGKVMRGKVIPVSLSTP